MDEVRDAIVAKIKELEWKNQLRSLEVINWLNDLLKMLPDNTVVEVAPKSVIVELPDVDAKPVKQPVKKKIVFNKKK